MQLNTENLTSTFDISYSIFAFSQFISRMTERSRPAAPLIPCRFAVRRKPKSGFLFLKPYTLYRLPFLISLYLVRFPASLTPYALRRLVHPVSSMQHQVTSIQHPVSSIQHQASPPISPGRSAIESIVQSGWTGEGFCASKTYWPVRTKMVGIPTAWAPMISVPIVSPIMAT